MASRTDHVQITDADQFTVGGGESGYIADRSEGTQYRFRRRRLRQLIRYDRRTSQGQSVAPWIAGVMGDIDKQKFRFPWTAPLVFSPTNSATLYYRSQYMLATNRRRVSWQS